MWTTPILHNCQKKGFYTVVVLSFTGSLLHVTQKFSTRLVAKMRFILVFCRSCRTFCIIKTMYMPCQLYKPLKYFKKFFWSSSNVFLHAYEKFEHVCMLNVDESNTNCLFDRERERLFRAGACCSHRIAFPQYTDHYQLFMIVYKKRYLWQNQNFYRFIKNYYYCYLFIVTNEELWKKKIILIEITHSDM